DQPGYGKAKMLAFPVRASATPATIRRPAPRLGEHTAEVLGELGLSRVEIERLAAAGIVAPACSEVEMRRLTVLLALAVVVVAGGCAGVKAGRMFPSPDPAQS